MTAGSHSFGIDGMSSGRNVGECRYGGAYQWYRPLREAAMVRMGHNRRNRRRCFQLVLKDRPDQGQRLVSGCVGVLQDSAGGGNRIA
jgi:hypothetical protein